MAYGIFLVALGGRAIGTWVRAYDPEKSAQPGVYPTGWVDDTRDPAEALQFESLAEASQCYRQQSRTCPLRPDGKPNRPMLAFTVEIVRLPDA